MNAKERAEQRKRIKAKTQERHGKDQIRFKDSFGIAPQKDAARMSMRFLVSTPTVDRDWEIVVPGGRQGDSYAKSNGPWFFNHQQSCPYAIGSTKERPKDPTCPLDIQVDDAGIIQTCYFNQATKEAEILYRLYDEGDMSATSIGFQGLLSTPIVGDDAKRLGSPYPVKRWDSWEHVETSLVGVGANRDAITQHYHRGSVGALTLPESMKSAFAPFLLPSKIWSPGAKFPRSSPESTKQSTPTVRSKMADETNSDPKQPTHDALETYANGIAAVLEALAPKLAMSELEDIKGAVMQACKGAWDSAAKLIEDHGGEYSLSMPNLPAGISFDGMEEKEDLDFADEPEGDEKPKDEDDKPKDEEAKGPDDDTADDDDEELDDEEEKAFLDIVTKLEGQIEKQEKILATA